MSATPPRTVGPTLDEIVAIAVFDRGAAALESDEREVHREIVDRLTAWWEENWRDWLANEDGSLPFETDPTDAWLSGFDAALDYVRGCWQSSGPVARTTIAKLGEQLAELREEGPADE